MSKTKEREELCINADIYLPDGISIPELVLLQSHFSEILRDVLLQVEREKELLP